MRERFYSTQFCLWATGPFRTPTEEEAHKQFGRLLVRLETWRIEPATFETKVVDGPRGPIPRLGAQQV
jgi:hypothetical protein